jgi:ATP adenylyltransferase
VDILWTPWRYSYIKSGSGEQEGNEDSCIFCALQEHSEDDESKFILHRASHNYIVLNIFPYISGHLLIVPYSHIGDLDRVPKEASDEMMDLTKRCQTVLNETYHPQGFNLGMNLGRAAGAGVAGHVHFHIMPRWTGDGNFMSTVGETRVLPEDLSTTYGRLVGKF